MGGASGLGIPYGEEVAELFFAAREVSFHRAKRPVKEAGDFRMREALLVVEVDRELFVGGELAECSTEVLLQVERARRWRFAGLGRGIDRQVPASPAAASVAPLVMRDAEQPSGECRVAAKAREAVKGVEKRLLREVVGERVVAAAEMSQEMADARLVSLDERGKGSAVAIDHGACDQFAVGNGHDRGAVSSALLRARAALTMPKSSSATPMRPGMAPAKRIFSTLRAKKKR